jgi:hypothetical protein
MASGMRWTPDKGSSSPFPFRISAIVLVVVLIVGPVLESFGRGKGGARLLRSPLTFPAKRTEPQRRSKIEDEDDDEDDWEGNQATGRLQDWTKARGPEGLQWNVSVSPPGAM